MWKVRAVLVMIVWMGVWKSAYYTKVYPLPCLLPPWRRRQNVPTLLPSLCMKGLLILGAPLTYKHLKIRLITGTLKNKTMKRWLHIFIHPGLMFRILRYMMHLFSRKFFIGSEVTQNTVSPHMRKIMIPQAVFLNYESWKQEPVSLWYEKLGDDNKAAVPN